MKKTATILVCALSISACGPQKDPSFESVLQGGQVEELRSKKKALEAQQKIHEAQLTSINEALSKLDTLQKLPLVSTQTAHKTVFKHYLNLQGNVKTRQNMLLYPEVPGILKTIHVREGNAVKKGQILAVIDDGGLSKQLEQLESQKALAKTIFERQERLWAQKIGSEIEFLKAQTNYISQKNAVAQLKSQLEKTTVTAPFDGTIDAVYKEEGTLVSPGPGAEIFRLLNLDNMYVESEVPESYVSGIKPGTQVIVTFPVIERTVKTTVRQVGNFIDPNNRAFLIEVDVPNPQKDIKPNLTARLKINDYQNKNALLLPQSIVSENARGEQYVYTVIDKNAQNEGRAQKVQVTTGKSEGGFVEILAPLTEGTEYILEGARTVRHDQKIKISNP